MVSYGGFDHVNYKVEQCVFVQKYSFLKLFCRHLPDSKNNHNLEPGFFLFFVNMGIEKDNQFEIKEFLRISLRNDSLYITTAHRKMC